MLKHLNEEFGIPLIPKNPLGPKTLLKQELN